MGRSGGGYGQIVSNMGRESRETTLRNAKRKIEALATQVIFKERFYSIALSKTFV